MSCQKCGNDCVGKRDFTEQHLDISIDYRASDCEIDSSNSPWWVEVNIDSTRGSRAGGTGGADIKASLAADSEINVLDTEKETYVPCNSQGRLLEFRIEQVSNRNPPRMGDLELDLELKEGSSYENLRQIRFQRRLSQNP